MYDVLLTFLVLINLPFCWLVELDIVECGIDNDEHVSVGDVELDKYPWLGILYYTDFTDAGEVRSVTTVALIQKEFVIACAADIGPMPKHNFRRNSRVLLGEPWNRVGRRVRNYVIHPEYGETFNTVALIQLKDIVRFKDMRPLCPPPDLLRNPVFYVVKFKSDYNELSKEVIPVAHIPSDLCREFYIKANLYTEMMRPPHAACAVSLDESAPCVWDAGAALVARDVWGRWQLLGLGVRGPGCGAPSRYLDMTSYMPWIQQSLSKFNQVTISRIDKQNYVLRSSGQMVAKQKFGACDYEERVNLIFRERIDLRTDNTQFQFMTYNMSIYDTVEFTCLTFALVNATASSEMRILHNCPREESGPCYRYGGSVFDVSVYIMFSTSCLFEMHAWGQVKDSKLLDMQEWKWEEGTYYEDFAAKRTEYRGPTFMTDFGYEPLDESVWVPEFDVWTTTEYVEITTTRYVPRTTTTAPWKRRKYLIKKFSLSTRNTPVPRTLFKCNKTQPPHFLTAIRNVKK